MSTAAIRRRIFTLGLGLLLPHFALAQTTLVATGSVWKYLDNGSDQGTAWQGLLFDDLGWASGRAQLGYGDGDEATLVNGGPATNRLVTTYFRHTFLVPDPLVYSNLAVRLLRDDGGVVYLNGVEVFRSNMPTNEITYATFAARVVPSIDESTNFHANSVDPALLSPGPNVLAVEIHQASATSSDISFDLELIGNFAPTPPSILISNPTNGPVLTASISVTAEVFELADAVAFVEFFEGETKLGEAASPPYSLVWANPPRGTYSLTAVATDRHGLSGTSAPVTIVVSALVGRGAIWKYLADGSDQGAGWKEPAFDDSSWAQGPAQLGYGDGDEATVIEGGPSTNRFVTSYFRHYFQVADPAEYTNLVVRLVRDDGGVVYLNGIEVFRSNLPEGPVNFLTWASEVVPNGSAESEFYATRFSSALLVPGTNVLAVEIHQANNTSSDISFDLELLPNVPPMSPVVTISSYSPLSGTLLAPAILDIDVVATSFDSTVAEVAIHLDHTMLGVSTAEPFALSVSNVDAGHYTLCAVATTSSGMVATSAPVTVMVAPGPILTSLIPTGSVWKYLDTGATTLGTTWKEVGFNDSAWNSGPAVLGYGGATKSPPRPEATLINCCGPTGKYMTDYFRHQFFVPDASELTNLSFRVLRDDGVVVYLNGTEIFRMNMPNGPITSTNLSSTTVGGTNETFRFPTNISPALLVNGLNLLAVELHQSGPNTSDAAFDLELTGVAPPLTGSSPPDLTLSAIGSDILIIWTATNVTLEAADTLDGPWATVTEAVSSPYRTSPSGASRFYRLRQN